MPEYLVWLSSDTRLVLPTSVRLEGPDALVEARSLPDPIGLFPAGLTYSVALKAPSLKDAMTRAAAAAEHLADSLAWVHATHVADPSPIVSVEAASNSGTRQFGQFIQRVPLTVLPRRFFREATFGLFYTAWGAQPDDSLRERVGRALRLFRRSVAEADPIDGFEDIWGALESINPLLQEKYKLPTKFIGGKCKKCDTPIEVVGSSAGIKYALLTLAGHEREVWQQVRDLRRDIAHGVATHQSIVGRVSDLLPALRRSLAAAVLDIVQVASPDLDAFARTPLNPGIGSQALFTSVITGWQPPPVLAIEELPYVEVAVAERQRIGNWDTPGKRRITFDVSYTARNLSGTMSDIAVELLVPKDPEDTEAVLQHTAASIKRADA
jgi:hypothetical protein